MLDGVMLLWFAEVVASFVFVASDIKRTPESPVLMWGFVIVTLFTGPIGLVLYILSCREPLPGVHAEYVRARWRQVVGSTLTSLALVTTLEVGEEFSHVGWDVGEGGGGVVADGQDR